MRRNIKWYKNMGYKLPFVTFMANSWLAKTSFVGVLILSMVGTGYVLNNTTKNILKPYVPVTPWISVNAENTMSITWLEYVMNNPPENSPQWETNNTIEPREALTYKQCNTHKHYSKTLLLSNKATSQTHNLHVNIYSPGTSRIAFNHYKEALTKCSQNQETTQNNNNSTSFYFDNNLLLLAGDTLTFITQNTNTTTTDFKNITTYYEQSIPTTLTQYSCLNINVTNDDAQRNYYTNPDNYTGKLVTETIQTQVSLENVPNAITFEVKELPKKKTPQAPLPANMQPINNNIQKPVIPPSPDDNNPTFEKTITYRTPDDNGPGCGWKWHGLKPTKANNKKIVKESNTLKTQTQEELDNNAKIYINQKIHYVRQVLNILDDIDTWNKHVTQTQQLHEQWNTLEQNRKNFKPTWDKYLTQYDNWASFDMRKNKAQTQYTNAFNQCKQKQDSYTQWEQTYGKLYRAQKELRRKIANQPKNTITPTTPKTTTTTNNPTNTTTTTNPPTTTTTTPPETPNNTTTTQQQNLDPTGLLNKKIPNPPTNCKKTPTIPRIITQPKPPMPLKPTPPPNTTIPNTWRNP